MRRILLVIALLGLSASLSGCDRNTANANNANGDDATTGQTVSNSNMAPTGGPGPEPENAGAVSKGSNTNKTETKNSNKR
jgi:predicted small secreted protein